MHQESTFRLNLIASSDPFGVWSCDADGLADGEPLDVSHAPSGLRFAVGFVGGPSPIGVGRAFGPVRE